MLLRRSFTRNTINIYVSTQNSDWFAESESSMEIAPKPTGYVLHYNNAE